MKKLMICAFTLSLGLVFSEAHAQGTAAETTKAETHKAEGKMKRAGHRVKKGLCLDGDAKCKFQKGGDKSNDSAAPAKDTTTPADKVE